VKEDHASWDLFNWIFIRKAIEVALQGGPDERELCPKLVHEVCTAENGFEASDFAFAFDYLTWNVDKLADKYPSYVSRSAYLMANIVKSD